MGQIFIGAKGVEPPATGRTVVTAEDLLAEYPRTPEEFFDRALLNISRIVKHPAAAIEFDATWEAVLFSVGRWDGMVDQLVNIGYIARQSGTRTVFLVTPKGWERIEKLKMPGRDSRQAFVAMWFDKALDEVFENGIKPAIEWDGATRAMRIDLKEHNGKIDDEIVAEIRRSRYLVADFTGNRGGVYFETGFALGLGLPVIWCVRDSDLENVHFDTRQYNHIAYTNSSDLHAKLLNRIRATIT